jgi:predicted pyridoxine 5'-phosphate oxidase superfamily flavin-nucleotide-binding protein
VTEGRNAVTTNRNPFHAGEIAVQERTGERVVGAHNGAMIRDAINPAARAFVALQRTLAVATFDDEGRAWASLWLGEPDFVRSDDDGRRVNVSFRDGALSADDPVRARSTKERPFGMLAIDLSSRRRVRINGVVAALDDEGLTLNVEESFVNCPKYIQRRTLERADLTSRAAAPSQRGDRLDDERRLFIERADTLFVASRHPTRGVDASHRGGDRGFVRVTGERTLRVPDYPGNSMFQTLGNFEIEPRAGVALVDFERGRLLSLTGTVTVTYDAEDPSHPTGGTGRYWELTIESWLDYAMPAGLAFRFVDRSPFNPPAFGDAPCPLLS